MTRAPMPTTLQTPRLRLRKPDLADASRIAMFIGEWDVARMLARVPYPYTEQDAVSWIGDPGQGCHQGQHYVLVHANGVIGAVGVGERDDGKDNGGAVELGYWLAKPFWGRGLVTEAAAAVIFALRQHDPRAAITCSHFVDNESSARVIRKLGFVQTGERMLASVSRGVEVRSLNYRLPLLVAPAARSGTALTPA